jgi:hypothetical protein
MATLRGVGYMIDVPSAESGEEGGAGAPPPGE